MTELELPDMFIQERINMLLLSLKKTETTESKEESEQFFQAEVFINMLTQEEQNLIEIYINHFIGTLALEEPYLYRHGFLDGVRVAKLLGTL